MSKGQNNLATNLQALMQHYQLTETEIARRTQVGQPVVHRMIAGTTDNPKIKTISPIANLFGLSISSLLRELPPRQEFQAQLSEHVVFGWHAVPLLSLIDLASGIEVALQRSRVVAHTDLPPTEATFAIALTDDSMLPIFPEKTLCIIEPQSMPKNAEFAVFHLAGTDTAVFRQAMFYGEDLYLKATGEEAPAKKLTSAYECLGVMKQARVDLR